MFGEFTSYTCNRVYVFLDECIWAGKGNSSVVTTGSRIKKETILIAILHAESGVLYPALSPIDVNVVDTSFDAARNTTSSA